MGAGEAVDYFMVTGSRSSICSCNIFLVVPLKLDPSLTGTCWGNFTQSCEVLSESFLALLTTHKARVLPSECVYREAITWLLLPFVLHVICVSWCVIFLQWEERELATLGRRQVGREPVELC